jgi:hypothetical protein
MLELRRSLLRWELGLPLHALDTNLEATKVNALRFDRVQTAHSDAEYPGGPH